MRRLELALQRLQEMGLEAGIVSSPASIYYLTGFYPSAQALLVLKQEPVLLVSPMDSAAEVDVELRVCTSFRRCLKELEARRLGVEKSRISLHFAETALRGRRLVDMRFLSEMRMVKDGEELRRLRKAAKAACRVMEACSRLVGEAKSERELAAQACGMLWREAAPAFDVIVASGQNSAKPHHTPQSAPLRRVAVVDLGARVEHYCSDITRSFLLDAGEEEEQVYSAVVEALEAGVRACTPGRTTGEVEAEVRRVLREYGLERFIAHAAGHSIGIEVHEAPSLRRRSKTVLRENMVLTVEPGVYGSFGVRVEDMVLVKTKPEVLSRFRR
ncbi:MAG: aminopeptidase P family protein [Euryarchaeota archaeon]|nr:aminopeptidase P family protein [Euryarchaeota archaeon]